MGCNKEEAIRAMQIAEKRLLKQDYAGAKVMALKAKKLFPLDNLSQFLAVCEVHCSAQLVDNGLCDWYRIIQVEPLSDEVMIRKQYHKLALLLHPDKNKIPGAEAAFKLVVEANNILSDQTQRMAYDLKRKHLSSSMGQQQSTETNSAQNSSSNFNRKNRSTPQQQPEPHQHPGFTFWTECPRCMTRHQYYCNMFSHIVCCTRCFNNFMAFPLPHLNSVHMDGGRNQPQQSEPHQGYTFWAKCPRCITWRQFYHNLLSHIVCCTHCFISHIAYPPPHLDPGHMDRGSNHPQQSTGIQQPQRSDFDQRRGNGEGAGETHAVRTSTPLRRSPCDMPDVMYNGTEPGYSSPPKKARVEVKGVRDGNSSANAANTNTSASTHVEGEVKEQDREKEQVESNGLLEEINIDFKSSESDKGATSKKASVEVKEVPDGNGSANAVSTNTSASFLVEREVKYKDKVKEKEQMEPSVLLKENNTASKPSGSAEEKGKIYRKARVDVNGVRDSDNSTNATNTNTSASTHVEGVVKEQDREREKEREQVEPSGLLNENDTAFKINGSTEEDSARVEVNGVPDGNRSANATNSNTSASIYVEGDGKDQYRETEKEREKVEPSGSVEDKGAASEAGNIRTKMMRCESPQPNADAECLYEYPDAEFFNFDMCRTCNKFQEGNIWALYSDLDTYPKYYGLICKVEHEPFNVHINWLKACPKSVVERAWLGENLPISCGKFRVTTQNTTYDKPDYFSHMVSARQHVRGNYYDILPGVGEIWAVYKSWSAGWTVHDFRTCKFDIVEIRELRANSTVVWPLSHVPGFKSVFMPEQVDGTGSCTWEVPESEYIMFSHKIPCIRLTEECGGNLRGFWELDPASVPYTFLYHDK
ncbi:DNAJ heat shock N-terminal domain-containing protein [Rhynchospora pubera]|uniref:DNAJ heat shock N-terminal domain-containing protein n=1 Tax=Rhynchospora pubera TaxID=906938 RepID=A0AAV8D3Q5_9POAL|nr:DNAJ heat shock N-terminal domain-containing protein [Rhynchospora pubera]